MSILKTIISLQVLINNKVGDVEDSSRLKLLKPKTRRSESRKLSKSKKPSKSENLPKFATKKVGPSLLTSDARMAFNNLVLTFTKALIIWHFELKFHI